MPSLRRQLCALLVGLPILALGVSSAEAAPFSPTLSGVVRLPDGRPAAHITLQATADREDFAKGDYAGGVGGKELFVIRTDGEGRYQTQLASSDLPIHGDEARFDGFLISPDGAGWAPLQLRVTARLSSPGLDIRLRKGDQVHGTVLAYPGGAPKPGAKVYAIIGLLRPAIMYETEADRAGRYTIPTSLPPGEYVVGAAADGYGFLAEDRRAAGAPGASRELTLRLIRDVRLRIQVLDSDGLSLRDQAVTVMAMGDRSNVAKPGSETGLDTRTDADGNVIYTFRYHETYVPLSNAYRSLTVWVRTGDQASPRVTVDAIHKTDVSLTLRLRPVKP